MNRYYYKVQKRKEAANRMLTEFVTSKMLDSDIEIKPMLTKVGKTNKKIYHLLSIWILTKVIADANGKTFFSHNLSDNQMNHIRRIIATHGKCISGKKISGEHWLNLHTYAYNSGIQFAARRSLVALCEESKIPWDLITEKFLELLKDYSK